MLPDGSYLSWNQGIFHLGSIELQVPFLGLSKMLRIGKGVDGVNWKRLLLSVSLTATRFGAAATTGLLIGGQ